MKVSENSFGMAPIPQGYSIRPESRGQGAEP